MELKENSWDKKGISVLLDTKTRSTTLHRPLRQRLAGSYRDDQCNYAGLLQRLWNQRPADLSQSHFKCLESHTPGNILGLGRRPEDRAAAVGLRLFRGVLQAVVQGLYGEAVVQGLFGCWLL
jgi:hypothetical protein